mmetsp:Transcript_48478/g.115329  ORF Transcript_48478/g.115329 Transcript_48478/m.115329 type:complete len:280 (-) Transcript_48478:1534-2373(-)
MMIRIRSSGSLCPSEALVVEHGEEGHGALHPVCLLHVRGHRDLHDEIGRVPRGRERALALARLVQRARVVPRLNGELGGENREELDDGHRLEQHLGRLFAEDVVREVPRAPVEEEPVDEAPVVRLVCGVVEPHEVVPPERVDGHLVLAGVVLEGPSEERLREEEPREPEDRGGAVVDPLLQKGEAPHKVVEERPEGLAGWVAGLQPQRGDFAFQECVCHRFEVGGHDDQALHREHQLLQRRSQHLDDAVEAEQLLGEHRVHAFVVVRRVQLTHLVDKER